MCCLCGCGAIWSGRGRGWRPDSRPVFLVGVHIRCCGNGGLGFRPYGGSLGRAPSNQTLSPLTYGASLWLGMPSLRSCSVGPPPSAIHGRGRLPRHPCRGAHCAEPALGLPTGQIKIKSKIKSQSEAADRPTYPSSPLQQIIGGVHPARTWQKSKCGSGLAREGVVSVDINVPDPPLSCGEVLDMAPADSQWDEAG
jgi:hypothetical protein